MLRSCIHLHNANMYWNVTNVFYSQGNIMTVIFSGLCMQLKISLSIRHMTGYSNTALNSLLEE